MLSPSLMDHEAGSISFRLDSGKQFDFTLSQYGGVLGNHVFLHRTKPMPRVLTAL